MARLKSRHKRLIVRRLATFVPPEKIREELQEEFGIDANYSQIAHYDPNNSRGQSLAANLKELFQEIRTAFLEMEIGAAIRHKAVRLRRIERAADEFQDMGNYRAELEALEQAAKETGSKYTNRTEVSGPDGGPVQVEQDVTLSDAELARIASEDE